MVSKMVKRTPTKTIKDHKNHHHHHHQRRRKKSPIKKVATAASIVVSSINKSIYTCHRRLIKIFTKLTKISTPKKTPSKKGYRILQKAPEHHRELRRSLFPPTSLPPLSPPEKKTVFLDLDETLVHSKPNPPPEKYDFIVRPVIDGERVDFYVLKRPFVDELLKSLSENFEIVVFTAGIEEYASLVIEKIDWRGVISHRLYRDSCKEIDGKFVKDLSEMGRDLKRVVIVDDNPNSYLFQPDNAIRIRPFTDDLNDSELRKLVGFFEGVDGFEDMRDAVKCYIGEGDKNVEM